MFCLFRPHYFKKSTLCVFSSFLFLQFCTLRCRLLPFIWLKSWSRFEESSKNCVIDRNYPDCCQSFDLFSSSSFYQSANVCRQFICRQFADYCQSWLQRPLSSPLTSAASPAALSVSCRGPLATESWCCGMEECLHSSALCLLPALCSLAPSFSTLLCGSETKPAFIKKEKTKERERKKQKRLQ